MISAGLEGFAGKRVLLLQGPVGPFFRRLARDLRGVAAGVWKIDFNGGDWLFSPPGARRYTGAAADWPAYLAGTLDQLAIDVVLLFGDCRPLHRAALDVAAARGIEVGVFEEGYLRPDFITLERHGVNGHSRLARVPQAYDGLSRAVPGPSLPVGNAFWHMAASALLYYLASVLLRPAFPRYQHHRPLSLGEGVPWLRSVWRKQYFRLRERGLQARLAGAWSGDYFLVVLQVHNDAQIHVHSEFASVEQFIEHVVGSFKASAPAGARLVIKHHPMDRGYHDYSPLVAALAARHQLAGRVHYIHDQHLPTLLEHARGVVLVNSTVGLSALDHGAPLKVCGNALYDMPGLTFQGSLADFWQQARQHRPDAVLYARFRAQLQRQTQLNGSFYRPLRLPGLSAGLVWRVLRESTVVEHDAADCRTV